MIDWTQIGVAFVMTLPATIAAMGAVTVSIMNFFKIREVKHIVNSKNDVLQLKVDTLGAQLQAREIKDAQEGYKPQREV